MAVTSQKSLVLYWGPDFDDGPWGLPTLTNCVTVLPQTAAGAMAEFAAGIRLAAGSLVGTYRTPVRTLAAFHSWGPAQVVLRPGSATGIRVRLWTGTVEKYWTGTAWATATTSAHWNTIAEVYAHLPTFTGSSLGFTVEISRATTTAVSPVLAGIAAVARVMFASTSGDDTRASSWMDDLLHRVLIRRTLVNVILPGADEFTAAAGSVVDLSAGVGQFPFDVTGVEAVYDVTADPHLVAPLAGTWNAGTQVWMPTVPFVVGHKIHVRFLFRPEVEHSSDGDFFTDRLPSIVFESVTATSRTRAVGETCVVDEATQVGVAVMTPDAVTYQIQGRVLAARTSDRDRITDALRAWLGDGVVEVSPSTSLPIVLDLAGIPEPGPVVGSHSDSRFQVTASVQEWAGQERAVKVVIPGGFEPGIETQEE